MRGFCLILTCLLALAPPVHAGACAVLADHASGQCTARVTCAEDAALVEMTRTALSTCAADPRINVPAATDRTAFDTDTLNALVDRAGGALAFRCCLAIALNRP